MESKKESSVIDIGKYIKWFSKISKDDVSEVGGKAANLGEMYNIGLPVPPGFAVTAEAYTYFLEETKLKDKIYELLGKLDVENTEELENTAKKIKEMIVSMEMPQELKDEILEAYEDLDLDKNVLEKASGDALNILKRSYEPPFVAVRSSATAEDSKTASFAGQQETFLNVKGNTNVIDSVKKCWASLFTSRSIYYRIEKGFKHEEVFVAVVVQIMINSDKSGVVFSRDPINQTENIVVESVFGLGEGIVSGTIQPDYCLVSRDLEILKKKLADKKIAFVRSSSGETEKVKLTEERSKSQVLSDYEIKRLADYAIKLEEHYNLPQDIEFAIDSGKIYIVQTRPVTTLGKVYKKRAVSGKVLVSGEAASPGIGSGKVRVILDLDDLKKIKKGDILVTKMTNPDMVVTMQKSAGIVTDEGGLTAHAAIVSREMGIAGVVGTKNATEVLKDGMYVTVDGFSGKVYSGKGEEVEVEIKPVVDTQTKIKVNVDLPSFAERAAKTKCKDVGLLRIEGIIAESGRHPFYFLKEDKIKDYEDVIFKGIDKIAEYFDELWVRTSDIRSDEYMNLEGASKEIEANPMLGMHGIRAGLKDKEILRGELLALKRISEKNTQIGILLPQLISLNELKQVKDILKEIDFLKGKVGVMVETPAAVEIIKSLCEEGIDFISFGTNDLTQYTLAIDRGNKDLQYLFDEMNPAILSQLSRVIKVCKKYQVETSICGQAANKKEMVEFLVKEGIDSISTNADKSHEISKIVAELEAAGQRGINQKAKIEDRKEEEVEDEVEDGDNLARENNQVEEKSEAVAERGGGESKENKENIEQEKKGRSKEEWKETDFGIDVFAPQQKQEQTDKVGKEEEEIKSEEQRDEKGKHEIEEGTQTLAEMARGEAEAEQIMENMDIEPEIEIENDLETEEDKEKEQAEIEKVQEETKVEENKLEEDSGEGVLDIF